VADLAWLLDRGYARPSSIKIVGDRYRLTERQRIAVRRATCTSVELERRRRHMRNLGSPPGMLVVDGFNVIVTVEAALSGGVLLVCMDSTIRDLASVHGSYRKVEETLTAIDLIGDVLHERDVTETTWLLDSPVSNSGRLAHLIRNAAEGSDRNRRDELHHDVDAKLAQSAHPVATSDSHVLGLVESWVNLAKAVVERIRPKPWIVDLSNPEKRALR
jgi:hypothetical protein